MQLSYTVTDAFFPYPVETDKDQTVTAVWRKFIPSSVVNVAGPMHIQTSLLVQDLFEGKEKGCSRAQCVFSKYYF